MCTSLEEVLSCRPEYVRQRFDLVGAEQPRVGGEGGHPPHVPRPRRVQGDQDPGRHEAGTRDCSGHLIQRRPHLSLVWPDPGPEVCVRWKVLASPLVNTCTWHASPPDTGTWHVSPPPPPRPAAPWPGGCSWPGGAGPGAGAAGGRRPGGGARAGGGSPPGGSSWRPGWRGWPGTAAPGARGAGGRGGPPADTPTQGTWSDVRSLAHCADCRL